MGRNRKNHLGGGKWGEAMMETIMNAHSQQQRHNSGGKMGRGQRSWEKNIPFSSRPSSTSPSPYQARNKGLKYKLKTGGGSGSEHSEPLYQPRTANQALYLKYLSDHRIKIVLGVGPAGCGKTLFACHRAVEELLEGGVKKIVITRPMVSVEDESVGFLPGDLTQKMAPWTRPIFDIFHEYFDPLDVQDMIRRGVVEISPLAYMRGRTFKDAFIIADEMQNITPNQMLMLTTRLGENAKMAITGDLKQSDKGLENNGLVDFMRKLYTYRRLRAASGGAVGSVESEGGEETRDVGERESLGVKLVQLCSSDICRSAIVSRVLDMYSLASHETADSGMTGNLLEDSPSVSDEDDKGEGEGEDEIEVDEMAVNTPSNRVDSKYRKPYSKNNIYYPKPKRHYQISVMDEPEYQENFQKNLKKVIQSAIDSQTPEPVLILPVTVSTPSPMPTFTPTSSPTSALVDTIAQEAPDSAQTKQENGQEIRQGRGAVGMISHRNEHGSSDCAMIPKRDQERGSGLFRYFI